MIVVSLWKMYVKMRMDAKSRWKVGIDHHESRNFVW